MDTNDASEAVRQINEFLRSRPWMDFELKEYTGYRLVVMGGIDPSVGPEVEIWFEGVAFVSMPIEWRTDTSVDPFALLQGDQARMLNRRFQVEQGHHVFRFTAEGFSPESGCALAAKQVGMNRRSEGAGN